MKHFWLVAVLLGSTACASGEAEITGDGTDAEAGATLDSTAPDTSSEGHPSPEAAPSGDDASDGAPAPDAPGPVDTGSPPDVTTPGDDGSPPDAPSPADAPSDAPSTEDAPSVQDSPTTTDLAPSGTGYTWQSMTSSSANTGKKAAPAVNDGNASTEADIDSTSGDSANAWEGAGVVFSGAHSVVSVTFVQGKATSSSDGWFEANLKLQFSSDGTTWTDSGWSCSPTYSYSAAVSGKSYVFQGTTASGIKGVRVVGQVNTAGNSWWAAVNEVEVFGS